MAFGRNKNSISGAGDYLRATDTVSRPMAIVMVLFIVCAIAAVAFSLFLGGKWAYDRWKGDKAETTTTVEVPAEQTSTTPQQTTNGSVPSGSGSAANTTPTQTTGSSANTSLSGLGTSTAVSANNTTSASTPVVTGASVPNTGSADVVAVFVVATAVGTLARYAVLVRRS